MKRLGAIVLFAGAVLLSTHILAPAASPPPPPAFGAADLAAIVQTTPVVEQVDAQVDRLKARLASPPAYPAPVRDPFRFGARTEPTAPKAAAPAPAPVAPGPASVAPTLPHLVAIATNGADGGLVRTAVLAAGDDLQLVRAGETYSKFLVSFVGTDAVELTDPATGSTFRISLQ